MSKETRTFTLTVDVTFDTEGMSKTKIEKSFGDIKRWLGESRDNFKYIPFYVRENGENFECVAVGKTKIS